MTQNQNVDKVSVIYYDKKNRPKYLELPITLFKSIIYVLPTITIISLVVVIAGILYFKQIKEMARRSESQEIIDLRVKNTLLSTQVTESDTLIEDLKGRLASKQVNTSNSLYDYGIFKETSGQKDLSSTPPASIQDINYEVVGENIKVNFKVQNENKDEKKLVGYIFIIHQVANKFHVYPESSFDESQLITTFNKGELFGVSRFRNTTASFPKGMGTNIFKIIIFSPTGDILLKNISKHEI